MVEEMALFTPLTAGGMALFFYQHLYFAEAVK